MSLFSELRRRNVLRVALAYVVLAWLALELTGLAVAGGQLPAWTYRFLAAMLLIGWPLALVFSWIYELTPEGLKREVEVEREQSMHRSTGQRLMRVTLAAALLIVLINLGRVALN